MKDQNTSGPRPETRASEMKRTKEMAHVPHPNLQYPVAAALSTPSNCARPVSTRQSPNSTFLSPTVNGTHPTQYSPERVPLSPARSASRGRQGSNSTSRHHDSPIVSVPDHERSRHQHHPQPRWNNHSPSDSEKAIHARQSPPNGHRPGQDRSSFVSEDEEVIEEHAVWILVYLSFLSPAVASLVSIYSLVTALFLLLFCPITVFIRPRKPLAYQIQSLLTPATYYQLRFVCSTYRSDLHRNMMNPEDEYQTMNRGNPLLLTLINILSPLYAAGIAVTAWVAAGFWFTSLILGDPDGRDKKDDGRTVVLGVRRLWERWLIRGLR
ncbi:hypothetical protein XANCAGTX0491_008040 [Xanthoria calcicola]